MPGNVKILIVDDNPMVLNLLRRGLGPFAEVATANDGTDALLKCVESVPDLIVCDYRMPGIDGRQLVEKLRGRMATAKVPIILVATRADLTEKLKMLHDYIEDFIEKPFFVGETCNRIKKVIDKIALEKMAREAPGESMLRGSLAQMNIMDLFQSLEMGHKTCALTLTNEGERCDMYFSDGQITHAVFGDIVGNDAAYKVMGWTVGTFQIDFSVSSTLRTTSRSTQSLLMEGLRLLDEAQRDAEENVLEL